MTYRLVEVEQHVVRQQVGGGGCPRSAGALWGGGGGAGLQGVQQGAQTLPVQRGGGRRPAPADALVDAVLGGGHCARSRSATPPEHRGPTADGDAATSDSRPDWRTTDRSSACHMRGCRSKQPNERCQYGIVQTVDAPIPIGNTAQIRIIYNSFRVLFSDCILGLVRLRIRAILP